MAECFSIFFHIQISPIHSAFFVLLEDFTSKVQISISSASALAVERLSLSPIKASLINPELISAGCRTNF